MSRDDELDAEVESHLRMAIEERMARGESRDAAERAARREFGNVTHIKEVTREMRGLWLERFVQDVRYGARALRRTPAFTLVAVLTLALAIGANSAVFTLVNSVLVKPLPFREPERLFLASYVPIDLPFEVPPSVEDRAWLDYRQRARAFEKLTAYTRMQKTLSGIGAGDAATVAGARVDASFFAVLGVSPMLGRAFASEEELADRNTVAIISHRLWQERFGGDPRAIGTRIALDGVPFTVVGVMPAGFTFPARGPGAGDGGSEIWTPLTMTLMKGNFFLVTVLGRLRDQVTVDQARAELGTIMAARPRDRQDDNWRALPAVLPLKDVVTGNVARSLLIFSGAVAFVLLIACVNVANLLLIRAATRRREIAVRVALGASRARIGRQLLTESLLVGVAGGAVGIAAAQIGVRALLAFAPAGRIPRLDEVHVDMWVLVFTIVLSLATGIIFGLVPALQSARRPPADALAHSGRMVGATQGRLRGTLVAAEVALALVLLTGAGLMIKSFARMRGVDKGYDANRVTRMTVDLTSVRYRESARKRAFHSALLEQLARIPGVHRAAGSSHAPMGGGLDGVNGNFVVDGPTPLPKGYSVDKVLLSPGYFATMGIRMLHGRDFTVSDDGSAPAVVIVSETVARRIWPDADAVGKRISMSDHPGPNDWLTVVGVVNDVVQDRSLGKHSTVYLPYLQGTMPWLLGRMTYVVRSDAGVNVAPAMRAALRDVDAAMPAQQLQTMDDAMLEVVAEPLFQTRLLTVFSVLALLLAAIGTYGVLAYDVAERTREIALRLALGATPRAVTLMVLRRTARFALSGAVIGIAASLALTRVLTKSLFEVTPNDPATLATVVAAILLVALAAGYLPARRASHVEVLTALPRE
jgi:putative ABC transport system permease protein